MKKEYKNVIIGAGTTGLSAAFYMKDDYLLIESEEKCGGAFTSIEKKGYFLDFGERFIRIENSEKKNFDEIFGENFFSESKLRAQIHLKNKRFWHPFQYNLYGMEKKRLDFCINEAKKVCGKKAIPKNFQEWISLNFGRGIASAFMIPYNRKIWCEDLSKMSYDWFYDNNVIPAGDISKIAEGASKSFDERGGSEFFQTRYYPKARGASAVPEFMEKKLKSPILYGSKVTGIDSERRIVFTQKGDSIGYRNLVSTIPLTELVNMTMPLQGQLEGWSKKLKHNSVLCIWVAVKREVSEKCHWVYFSEKKHEFARLYFQHNFSSNVAPKGKSIIGAVFTYRRKNPQVSRLKEQLVKKLIELNILENEKDIDFIDYINIKYGFCTPLLETAELSKKIRDRLKERDIFSIGRYGEWKYSGLEHAIGDGKKIASQLI